MARSHYIYYSTLTIYINIDSMITDQCVQKKKSKWNSLLIEIFKRKCKSMMINVKFITQWRLCCKNIDRKCKDIILKYTEIKTQF